MNLLLPGMHYAVDSSLHRLDPRIKMAAALGLMVLPFAIRTPPAAVLLAAFVGVVAVVSRAPLLPLARTIRTIFWLGLFMFLFYFFATPGEPLLSFQGITVTVEGFVAGIMQVYRLCLLVVISALLTYTTSPAQLAHGVEAVLRPLETLHFPVREVSLVLTIALRFVPTFFHEIETIARAQQARGADFQSGGPWRRIRSVVPIFVPVFVVALRRAEELATAMDARGFRSAPRRTRLNRLHLGLPDLLAALTALAAGLIILAVDRTI